jgi:hypothetical protein
MIELTLEELAVAVIALGLMFVVGAAWIASWTNFNARRRSVRFRVVCRLCRHVFEDRSGGRYPHCPACGAANERRRGG